MFFKTNPYKLIFFSCLLVFFQVNLSAQTFTFNNGGGDGLWNNASNWDQGSVPSGSDDIDIPSGQSVTYDPNADFTYTGSSFTISGTLNFGGQKIKMRGTPSTITVASTAVINNLNELSFENTSNGSVASGASVTIEDLKLKNFASLTINTNCINVTNKLENKNVASIAGSGCIDFTGSNYTNSSSGGIFGCTSGTASDCVTIGGGSTTVTFNGDGDGENWSDTDNWDGDALPNPETESVTIPDGFDVVYDLGDNLEFENSTIFSVCGSINLGSSHLHMLGNSNLSVCPTGAFTGHEIKLEDDAIADLADGSTINVEQIEVINNGIMNLNVQCITITDEIKNKNSGTIQGDGCFDFSGSTFQNSGTGGIFGCFDNSFETCGFPLVSLPVELIGYSVKVINNEIVVRWETATEIDNSHFEIFAGSDEEDFEVIRTVKGKGNSIETTKYVTAFKPILPGVIYVKLRQVDFSGDQTDYDIKSVIYSPTLVLDDIYVYPNPAKKIVSFGNLSSDQTYQYKLFSHEGTLIQSGNLDLLENTLSIAALPLGSYTVMVIDEQFHSTALRFIKL